MKIGRNDPCYCGSGKKYKKCCIDKEPHFVDSTKFAEFLKVNPDFSPRSYYVGRIAELHARLRQQGRSEALDADLMDLSGDLLEDLENGRLHALTRYGEGFRPTERRLLETLANRIWSGLILGGFEEQDILRPLLAFVQVVLTEGIGEDTPIAGAVLTTDEAGELTNWTLVPAAENADSESEAEGFGLDVKVQNSQG
ncbi:hypothetical protein B9G55_08275 [Saccharibacillus sp. O16]|nr:hypothetical protein B9G55_08275 [Saccharibacillus sp. O16]